MQQRLLQYVKNKQLNKCYKLIIRGVILLEEVIRKIIGKILDEDISKLNNNQITPEHLESWDSLAHLALVTSLEEEFKIEFNPDEINIMQNGFEAIEAVLIKHQIMQN